MENRQGNSGNSGWLYFGLAPKLLWMVTAAMKLKDAYSWEEKLWPTSVSQSVQSLSRVQLFATPWIAARQASLSIPTPGVHSNSRPSSQWCHPAISSSVVPFFSCAQFLPASESFPMSQLFAWGPKYGSFSFSIIPSKEIPGLISFRMNWLDLLAVQGTLKSLLQHHSSKAFFGVQLSSQSNSCIHTWPLVKP